MRANNVLDDLPSQPRKPIINSKAQNAKNRFGFARRVDFGMEADKRKGFGTIMVLIYCTKP